MSELVIKALMMLKAAYPRQELAEETIEIYSGSLEDMDPELLKLGVMRVISRSIFFPTVAEIRGAVADLDMERSGFLPPLAAWGRANDRKAFQPPEVMEAVKVSCGGYFNLRGSRMPAADRARFIEAYGEITARERSRIMELPAVRAYAADRTLGAGRTAVPIIRAEPAGGKWLSIPNDSTAGGVSGPDTERDPVVFGREPIELTTAEDIDSLIGQLAADMEAAADTRRRDKSSAEQAGRTAKAEQLSPASVAAIVEHWRSLSPEEWSADPDEREEYIRTFLRETGADAHSNLDKLGIVIETVPAGSRTGAAKLTKKARSIQEDNDRIQEED